MYKNTDLAVDLKTILRNDRFMKLGKDYQGVLRLDQQATIDEFFDKRSGKAERRCRDAHYTFTETLPWTMKRNPRVFRGRFITVTRREDGSLKPNFRPLPTDADLSVEKYALGVANELMWALEGLTLR